MQRPDHLEQLVGQVVGEIGRPGCRCRQPRWPLAACPLPAHRLAGQYLQALQAAAEAAGELPDDLSEAQAADLADQADEAWPTGLGPCDCEEETGPDPRCPIAAHARVARWSDRRHQQGLHAWQGMDLAVQLRELLELGRSRGLLDAVAFLQRHVDQRPSPPGDEEASP